MSRLLVGSLFTAALCVWPVFSKDRSAPKGDEAFLSMAAEADMTLAHIAKEAEQRATDGKVKDFGKAVAEDQTSDYEKLSVLSAKTGDAIPKAIDSQNDRTIVQINHYRGKMFDREFLRRQSAEDEKLAQAFKEEADHGANPDIKAYATAALPTIEQHLHQAQDLLRPKS